MTTNFKELLMKPKVKALPVGFNAEAEAAHLNTLLTKAPRLKEFEYMEFISAGGSGLVFKVKEPNSELVSAIKISREHCLSKDLMFFPKQELDALQDLSHENIVQLFETISSTANEVVAIRTSYISFPQSLTDYVKYIIQEKTNASYSDIDQVTEERLNEVSHVLANWFYSLAEAIAYMHRNKYYHMDLKPANILINKDPELPKGRNYIPIITDLGSCFKVIGEFKEVRVHFTLAYAHPELSNVENGLDSVGNGGLRSSANIYDEKDPPRYDLYAFGRTIQEILAVVESQFKEKCFSNYYFRYLHIIAALLLDGKNNSGNQRNTHEHNGVIFISDFPEELKTKFFEKYKIKSADELVERLKRFKDDYSVEELAPEFSPRQKHTINNTTNPSIPFTKRVSEVFNHVTMRKLMKESQLGYMIELYPGASHNRWSHSLGVYNLAVQYYLSLVKDAYNPLFKIIVNQSDISHGLLAAILHDIGQTEFGHDFEVVGNEFYHVNFSKRLLRESFREEVPLEEIIRTFWNDIKIDRLLHIIHGDVKNGIDNLSKDIINSAIDADKLDYIQRDSYYCGVSYGLGIDLDRFFNTLTIHTYHEQIRLAYYAKGHAAVYSLLLARYQLYGSVYFHHTFRCIQSMFVYSLLFAKQNIPNLFDISDRTTFELSELFYERVVCKKSWDTAISNVNLKVKDVLPIEDVDDIALDFVYRLTDANGKKLIDSIVKRKLYKRIFTSQIEENTYINPDIFDKVGFAKIIQENLYQAVLTVIKTQFDENKETARKKNQTSSSTTAIEKGISKLVNSFYDRVTTDCLIIIDLPRSKTFGNNEFPEEISDMTRKIRATESKEKQRENKRTINKLLSTLQKIQIFAEPEFYKMITINLSNEVIVDVISRALSL